ncbi:MAG: glycosyltransferase family 2 protein [Clostridiales bacterium]|nr:glycosyltransferase family 2 protein [Clostridiales bacterium]
MLDIVVPVYNEGKNIRTQLLKVEECIKSAKRVLIVYDFEEDDTLPALKTVEPELSYPIIRIRNKYGRGALNAIKTGLEEAGSEAVLVMMADLSDSIEIVDRMHEMIVTGEADLVCGSRYMKGGKQHGGPVLKGLFSRMAGVTLHLFSGIPTHDVTNSFKMYRKKMLDSITIESNGGFEIGMEITVKAYLSGYTIKEIPSEWFDRSEGKSNFHMWKWMPHYLHWYFLCIFSPKVKNR